MNRYILLLLILTGCASSPGEREILNMPLSNIWPLAELGNKNAMHALCYRHLYGEDGAQKDYEIAYEWCKKSAEKGHNSSLTLIAEMYYLGLYIEQDYAKAFEYYQKAANLGHDHAQLVLYVMYEKGQGIEKNLVKAKQWLKRSARNGNVQAKRLLAN
ncbi:tetratricopeptide repeat protein [Pleionea sediminis]|uniref:tetratricopeptide repeat protein n=1 Tax=Pleionea sediminis TaxID=2569479 RepID=UPI00118670BE|nr:tetratricopeptide repeat protein [Pleionea sediminis]